MEARELRLGNAINRQGMPIKVGFQNLEHLEFKEYSKFEKYRGQYSGIPITEEWMVRFGWGKTSDYKDDGEYCNNVAHPKYTFYYNVVLKSFYIESDLGIIDFDCEYVHSLQNIFFALTGEELTLKTE